MTNIEQKKVPLPEQMKEHVREEIMNTFRRMLRRDEELRQIIKENPEAESLLLELDAVAKDTEDIFEPRSS